MAEQIDSSSINLDSKIKAQLENQQLKIEDLDFATEARLKRKRKRIDEIDLEKPQKKVRFDQDEGSEEIQDLQDLMEANDALQAQKERHENGIKIEPFNIRNEVRAGIITKDGAYRLKRERDETFDMAQDDEQYEEDDDPWYKSVK